MVASPPPTAKEKRAPRGVLARKDMEDGPLEIILPEDSLTQIRSAGSTLQDNTFELLAHGRGEEVITVKYEGVYVIVDNGYLNWSCTVPPITVTSNVDEIRWSKWLESMRKDVECTFSILKGRWRILKAGVRIHGVDGVDDVWLT